MRAAKLPLIVRIAAFALICASPLTAWLAFGTVEPYGAPHKEFPTVSDLLKGRPNALDSLGQAVLDRSTMRRTAISLKYTTEYNYLHWVDTPLIVSGRGRWLFYKKEFAGGRCYDAASVAALLAQLDVLTDMATAAGLAMVVSVSPDKSWIYPEELDPRFHQYWRCRHENGALWRSLLPSEAPNIVDHGIPLLAAKSKPPRTKLFFHTDTHWTPYAGALAFRQLLEAIYPDRNLEAAPPLRVRGLSSRPTDMGNVMLLLHGPERFKEVDDRIAELVRDEAKTTIVHDSFYPSVLGSQIAQVFPNNFQIEFDSQGNATAVMTADRLVINTVERFLLSRIRSGQLSQSGAITLGILARNSQAAAGCVFHPADNPDPSNAIPVPELSPMSAPCVRIKLKDWQQGNLEIFLPKKMESAEPFEPGRSVVCAPSGSDTVSLVLPDYVQGRAIKIAVPEGSSLQSIELGERPRLGAPAAGP
jgi:hypothetical protein